MQKQPSASHFTFDWMGALILIGGMFAGTMLVAVLNTLSIFLFNRNFQYEDFYLIIANAAGFLTAIFAFDHLIVRPQTGRKLNFNVAAASFSTYLLVFPMMFGMMLIAEFISAKIPTTGAFFGPSYEFFTELMAQMTKDEATLIVLAVIMAPLFEEIIFRGIILKGLINKGMRPLTAILLSSLAFGIVHGNPWQFAGAVLLGSVLGFVYYKTKTLLLPILLHAFNNFCSALLIFYADTESFAETFKISEYLLLAAGVSLFGITCYLFSKKYSIPDSEPNQL